MRAVWEECGQGRNLVPPCLVIPSQEEFQFCEKWADGRDMLGILRKVLKKWRLFLSIERNDG